MFPRLSSLSAALILGLAIAPAAFAHGDASHDKAAASAPVKVVATLGALEIGSPFTRATLPNAPVGGGYLSITNTGDTDDRLVKVTTPIAKEGQIHEMAMQGDVMKMRQLADGLVIPAGETVTLEPGGFHLMFMGLNTPIVEGKPIAVTLEFEHAGSLVVDFAVVSPSGTSADGCEGAH